MTTWQLLSLLIWAEARSDGEEGMRAVASVIYHRAGGEVSRYEAVVTKRRQFSAYPACINARPWSAPVLSPDGAAWFKATLIAQELVNGTFSPTIRATHYHAYSVHPTWSMKMRPAGIIGRHVFYLDTKAMKTTGRADRKEGIEHVDR
jgi:spore germination cell wall hydrolase CwlJ-like protein